MILLPRQDYPSKTQVEYRPAFPDIGSDPGGRGSSRAHAKPRLGGSLALQFGSPWRAGLGVTSQLNKLASGE